MVKRPRSINEMILQFNCKTIFIDIKHIGTKFVNRNPVLKELEFSNEFTYSSFSEVVSTFRRGNIYTQNVINDTVWVLWFFNLWSKTCWDVAIAWKFSTARPVGSRLSKILSAWPICSFIDILRYILLSPFESYFQQLSWAIFWDIWYFKMLILIVCAPGEERGWQELRQPSWWNKLCPPPPPSPPFIFISSLSPRTSLPKRRRQTICCSSSIFKPLKFLQQFEKIAKMRQQE